MITTWSIYNCAIICSFPIDIDQKVETTFSELYIPPRMLPYGIYELKLTVTMTTSPNLTSSASIYVQIIPSNIIAANLIQFGTSMITHGNEQDLILDPGRFSFDFDEEVFTANVSQNELLIFKILSSIIFLELEL
jgi:hypothetical protein